MEWWVNLPRYYIFTSTNTHHSKKGIFLNKTSTPYPSPTLTIQRKVIFKWYHYTSTIIYCTVYTYHSKTGTFLHHHPPILTIQRHAFPHHPPLILTIQVFFLMSPLHIHYLKMDNSLNAAAIFCDLKHCPIFPGWTAWWCSLAATRPRFSVRWARGCGRSPPATCLGPRTRVRVKNAGGLYSVHNLKSGNMRVKWITLSCCGVHGRSVSQTLSRQHCCGHF